MKDIRFLIMSICFCMFSTLRAKNCQPTQIHISPGDLYSPLSQDKSHSSSALLNNNQAYLLWHSLDLCQYIVEIIDPESSKVVKKTSPAFASNFTLDFSGDPESGSTGSYQTFTYTAFFSGLEYEKVYEYQISTPDHHVLSSVKFLLASPYVKKTTRKIMVIADVDARKIGNRTLDKLARLIEEDQLAYGGCLSIGDLAYDLEDENGTRGDSFFTALEPIISKVPYIPTHGNHDNYANYSLIDIRTRNPLYNLTKNQYYSINYEGIHYLTVNWFYYYEASKEEQKQIFAWVEEDLERANSEEMRRKVPWIVFFTHYPLYCVYVEEPTAPEENKCYNYYSLKKEWDELFHKYSVDLALSAHEHSYERMGPIYQNKTASFKKSQNDPLHHDIINPAATVYIMDGTAGTEYFIPKPYDASGYTYVADVKTGYGIFYTENSATERRLIYEHYDSVTGEKIDYMNLIKTETRPIVLPTQDDGGSGATVLLAVLEKKNGAKRHVRP